MLTIFLPSQQLFPQLFLFTDSHSTTFQVWDPGNLLSSGAGAEEGSDRKFLFLISFLFTQLKICLSPPHPVSSPVIRKSARFSPGESLAQGRIQEIGDKSGWERGGKAGRLGEPRVLSSKMMVSKEQVTVGSCFWRTCHWESLPFPGIVRHPRCWAHEWDWDPQAAHCLVPETDLETITKLLYVQVFLKWCLNVNIG